MNPVIPGAGSSIFIHLWRSIHSGTYGCIAMDELHLLKLLHWLEKDKHPYVFISSKLLKENKTKSRYVWLVKYFN